jgi:hypothetical protein
MLLEDLQDLDAFPPIVLERDLVRFRLGIGVVARFRLAFLVRGNVDADEVWAFLAGFVRCLMPRDPKFPSWVVDLLASYA